MKVSSMTDEAKFWRKFIQGRILGITNDSDCTLLCQYLLFAIMLRRPFNVGRFICDEVLYPAKVQLIRQKYGHQGLAFPSIITALCYAAGVVRPNNAREGGLLPALGRSHVGQHPEHLMSTFAFHQQFWGGRGQPDFVPPQSGENLQLAPAEEELGNDAQMGGNNEAGEEEAAPEQPQQQPFQGNPDALAALTERLAGFDARLGTFDTRLGNVENLMQQMFNAQTTFYEEYRMDQRRSRMQNPGESSRSGRRRSDSH